MSKILKIVCAFVIAIGILGFTQVNAAEAELNIKVDKTTLQRGDIIEVSIGATSENGINGITGRLVYDENVLEYVKNSIKTDERFLNMGTFPEITMIANEGDLTDLTFCSVQFKVKENTAATQTQVKLTKSEETGKLLLSVMGESSEDVEFEDKVVTLEIGDEYPIEVIEEKTLTKIQVTNQPTKTSYKIGEKFDTTGMKVVAKYSDGTQKVITNYTYSPTGALTENDKKIIITYLEGNIEKTAEINIGVSKTGSEPAKEDIPSTGIEDIRIYVVILGVLLVTSFVGVIKYRV